MRRFVERLLSKIVFWCNHVRSVEFPTVKGIPYVLNEGKITIGRNVQINSKLSANPAGSLSRVVLRCRKGAIIEIGNNVGLSNCCLFAAKSISIGEGAIIGAGARIHDTDHHSVVPEYRFMKIDPDIKISPVTIEDYSFIGADAIVLKGVTIGKAAVVGAGSVVTRSIPAYEIWAGNPARKIGTVLGKDKAT